MNKIHFLVITSLLLIADAEPPRFRFRKSRKMFQRQQIENTSTESSIDLTTNQPEEGPYPPAMAPYPPAGYRPGRAFPLPTETRNSTDPAITTEIPTNGGPYPPSGWKPKGRQLELPTEEKSQPPTTYGPPKSEYGPPSETYGPPQESATESFSEPDDDDAVQIDTEIDETGPSKSQEGFYFITLPDGTIQKISYSTAAGGKIILKAETIGRQVETLVENQSNPRVVSFVQQYQRW